MTGYLLDTEQGRLYLKEDAGKSPEINSKTNLKDDHKGKADAGALRKAGKQVLGMQKHGKPQVFLMDLDEFQELKEELPHRMVFHRSLAMIRYCKLEKFNECLQGTMKIPRGEDRKEVTFGYFLMEERLFFVEDSGYVRKKLFQIRESLYKKGSLVMLLLALFESILEEDFLYLQHLEESLAKLEGLLMKKIPENIDSTIMGYRKRFSSLHAYYQQLMDVGALMQDRMGKELSPEEELSWKHYLDRVERFYNNIEMLREYLVQIRELYQSMIAERQNKVMSILTVITTIFFPLTLITGWYGMNFPYMPEFEWKYAYPVMAGVSIAILVLEIVYFKKRKML